MSIHTLTPEHLAKSLGPGLKYIAQKQIEDAVINACIPYIKEVLSSSIGTSILEVREDFTTGKIKFMIELSSDDWKR